MKPSKNYEKLVKHFESCMKATGDGYFKAYKCSSDIWTCGWGSTFNYKANRPVDQYDVIDQATADEWFSRETAEKYKGISEMLPATLNQDEVDACTSFAYNVGLGAFAESTFRKRINSGEDKRTVCKEEFPKWHHDVNGDSPGLVRRRAAEVALFCGNYAEVKKQTYGEVICEDFPEIPPAPLQVGWFEPRLIIDNPDQWEVGIVARGAGSDVAVAVAKIPVQMDMVKKFTSQYPNAKSFALPPREKAWPGIEVPTPKPAPKFPLAVPFYPQLDNPRFPSGTCNVTSVAMVLAYFGTKPKNPEEQLEMEVLRWMEDNGLDRHVHSDLTKAIQHYGYKDTFTTDATIEQIKKHLDLGFPCIVSGMFTPSGHIIVLTGYDSGGFWVNDPYGEWFSSGYEKEPIATRGKGLHYSFKLICNVSGGDGSIWCHFPSK